MLRAVSPGADIIITRYNQAMEAFITAGLVGEHAPAERLDSFGSAPGADQSASRGAASAKAPASNFPTVHSIQRQLRHAVRSSDAWRRRSAG